MEPTYDLPPDPSPNLPRTHFWTRSWRGFVNIVMRPVETRLGAILLAGLIVFAGGWKLWNRIEANDRAQRSRDAAALAVQREDDAFDSAQRDWVDSTNLYNACIARIEGARDTTDHLRQTLFAMSDLSDLFPGSDLAVQYSTTRAAIIDAGIPPVDVTARAARDCVVPGPEPKRSDFTIPN